MGEEIELIYVADAMCSWCWGFAPGIQALQEATGLPVRLVNGGLRPGEAAEAVSPGMKRFLQGCWTQVHEASGQPFDFEGLNKPEGWRYDTLAPACAVVTMRGLRPGRELDLYHRLQRAFYAEAVDITDPDTWPALLADFDVDPDEFVARATSEAARKAAWADFSQARHWGISGFPALLLRAGEELVLVSRGWAPTEPVVKGVQDWLTLRRAPVAEGASCEVDAGAC